MPDLLKRFVATPVESELSLHGATIKIATNCRVLANRLEGVFAPSSSSDASTPAVVWRVVVEPDDHPEVTAEVLGGQRWSHGGLALVTIGTKNFLALDLAAQEGISFISRSVAHNEKLFEQYFLPALISLLNESLDSIR